MARTDRDVEHYSWWSSLKHGGLLITPGRLTKCFQDDLPPLNPFMEERLRRDVFALLEEGNAKSSRLLNTLFEEVLGFQREKWLKGTAVPSDWTHRAVTGEAIKPSRVWVGDNGEILPVFLPDSDTLRSNKRLGVGRGRKSVSRVIEWMRVSQCKLAILTNGRQIRLIHAGTDYEAWCEWDIDLWFQEGIPGPQIDALRSLLTETNLRSPDTGKEGILLTAILESRKGQAELSSTLGENVRRAVENLIDASREAIDVLDQEKDKDQIRRAIYISATRLVMRFVVILFAESRGLLPRDNPIYHSSYGLQGLIEQLEQKAGGRGKERLRLSYSAWPRLLGLFRLIYNGSKHEAIPVHKYGGGLFQPGVSGSTDPLLRALAALENPSNNINDSSLYEILKKLTRCRTKVHQGTGTTWVEAPVDFSDLSTEYIGILYEGLLDYELRRADLDDPIVFLNIGDQPALPFSRLESMDERTLEKLFEKLKKNSGKKTSVEETEEEEEEEEYGSEEGSDDHDDEDESSAYDEDSDEESEEGGLVAAEDSAHWNESIHEWACKAALAGKLVRRPRGKRNTSEDSQHRSELSQAARQLVYKTILPGDWFLVRWGGTRKGSGTFYTRPQLAGPTTRRTLEPLLYEMTGGGKIIKKPEEILSLKVCDPAMGSGSFLVSALRLLVAALFESLHVHKRLESDADRTVCKLADGLPATETHHEILPLPIDHDEFEERLKARLKRHVVERCVYGVDIDPLAVELARLALWVETMDKNLPFHFLDHKLKCGNALVGCWFDRFQDYPVMAWEREGGDSNHTGFVHHFHDYMVTRGKRKGQTDKKGDVWTQAIKDFRNDVIKPEMKAWITAHSDSVFSFMKEGYSTSDLHSDIRNAFEELHEIPVFEEAKRAALYREKILNNPDLNKLKTAFNIWCSIWFWPGDKLDIVPKPSNFLEPSKQTSDQAVKLAMQYRFFHWEIEFPEVFTNEKSGFDAIVGNPPWEIQKPNSKEFFSNHDPIYRAYGKQEAKTHQISLFTANPVVEEFWIEYNAHLKGLSNFTKNAASPFGDKEQGDSTFSFSRSPSENTTLHHLWSKRRTARKGFSDPEHPFRHQGSADINTYKMFLEIAHALVHDDGYFGFIVPSGIYTDKGSTNLRELFLSECSWEWLFGFENREGIFDIHRSFKFCPVIVKKGGSTKEIKSTFMRRDVHDWENADQHVNLYKFDQIAKLSENSKALYEITNNNASKLINIILSRSIPFGKFIEDVITANVLRETDKTNDSRFFMSSKEISRYNWISDLDSVFCVEAIAKFNESGVFPIIEGKNIHQFTSNWMKPDIYIRYDSILSWYNKKSNKSNEYSSTQFRRPRIVFREIASPTNERTMIATYLPMQSLTTYTLRAIDLNGNIPWFMLAVMNSFTFDYVVRLRGNSHLSTCYDELPMLSYDSWFDLNQLTLATCSLVLNNILHSCEWLRFRDVLSDSRKNLKAYWAVSPNERLRLRCILDASIAYLYNLAEEDFFWILQDCDYPLANVCEKAFTRSFNPKGFWRVDKDKDPELRHTVLSLIAFHDLKEKGLEAFLAQNDGEGWMLPETLRLADYGLGHDDRAKEHQPVASRLGPRFLPWQLEQSVEESWEECEKHAKLISQILKLPSDDGGSTSDGPTDLFGNPSQTDLFGNVSSGPKNGRRQ